MNRVPNLDEYLEMVGLWRKLVPRDGRCLFRSVGEQLFGNQTVADELLSKCATYLEDNNEKFLRHLSHPVDQYLTSVRKAQNCAAHPHLDVFLEIVSSLYDCAIVVYHQSSGQPTFIATKPKHSRTIELCKIGKHYDTVLTRSRVAAYAQCQSLLFDLLYSQVFQMPDDEIDFGIGALRHKVNKRKDSVSEGMLLDNADDSGHGADSSDLSPNKMPFSYRAAKGLDINIFRNIAFDIWREENLDRAVGDQMLIPGNQCVVQLSDMSEDDVMVDSEAIIQDYDDETQIVSAFVQSLGMRVEVPREHVKSVSDRGGGGMSLEMAKTSNKRKFGVKQDVHWHNRPEQQKPFSSPNVVYWPSTTPSSCYAGPERSVPSLPSSGAALGPRHLRDRSCSEGNPQGQLTVQVSPSAFAAAAHQAGYPVSQVPSLMAPSPSRGEHPGGPQGNPKPVAKVYFNSVGKPAVCKLQLPRYNKQKIPASDCSIDSSTGGDAGKTGKDSRTTFSARSRCSSETAVGSSNPAPDVTSKSTSTVRSPIVSSIRPVPVTPTSTQPLMTLPVMPQATSEMQLMPCLNVPFVTNLTGPIDMSADYSKDGMGRDLPHGDVSTLRYFFNLGIQFFRMTLTQPLPPPPHSAAQWLPLQNVTAQIHSPSNVSPQQRSSGVTGQSVRVVPLMDIEHGPPHQQSPPTVFPHGAPIVSAPSAVYSTGTSAMSAFPGSVYVGPSYYPLPPGGPCPIQGLEGAPVVAQGPTVGSGPLQDGMQAMVAPTPIGGVTAPTPSWAYSAQNGYCYI